MLKLAVFDLDGTLAALGKGVMPEVVAQLRALEEKGSALLSVPASLPIICADFCGRWD